MDINLADGLCFSIFERVMVTSPVIFITAYDQYAIKAFKHNGIDYILKPIDEIELRASVERYRKSEQRQDKNMAFRNLLREYWSASRFRERILVQSGVVSKSIATNDVAYFYAFEKGTFLADFSDAHALASETLDKLEMELNPNQFFRVNRKLIVNINSIKEVHKYSLRQLELKLVVQCRVKPVVPAEKLMAFKNWLGGIPTTTP
jgi:DNA-binding LytR/AlgR family response regulator